MKNLKYVLFFLSSLMVCVPLKGTDFSAVPIDKVKEFWDRRPCNIRHSNKPIGTREYFDEVEKRKYFIEPHIPGFAEFEKWYGKRVLEIGCGLGTEAINFARHGADLTVIEVSQESLDIAKKRFKVYGLHAHFILGNAEDLDILLSGQEKFDLIWSFGVIHHSPHPDKILDQCKNFLKDDGELRIMVYSKISYKLFHFMRETGIWDFSNLDELISTYSEAQTGCPITYSFTYEGARRLFADFQILEMRQKPIFLHGTSQNILTMNMKKKIALKIYRMICLKNLNRNLAGIC